VVAKRKGRKDEIELPPAARDNPYAYCSRKELDAALAEVDSDLETVSPEDPEHNRLELTRRMIFDGYAWRMVRLGLITWSGGKPKGSDPPIRVTPGPPISDYVIEDRR
jgi:hypothetical protein